MKMTISEVSQNSSFFRQEADAKILQTLSGESMTEDVSIRH